MAKVPAKTAPDQVNRRYEGSVWNQRTDDIGSGCDPETRKIFGQMTGGGLVSTQQKGKGNNRRI